MDKRSIHHCRCRVTTALLLACLLLLLAGCWSGPRGPVVLLRNRYGEVQVLLNPAPVRIESTGFHASNFGAIRLPNGDLTMVLQDGLGGGLMARKWYQNDWVWTEPVTIKPPGRVAGVPAVAVLRNGQYVIALRDENGQYHAGWLGPDFTLDRWVRLEGKFRGDPLLVSCGSSEQLYLVGQTVSGEAAYFLFDSRTTQGGMQPARRIPFPIESSMKLVCTSTAAVLTGKTAEGEVGLGLLFPDAANSWQPLGRNAGLDLDLIRDGERMWLATIDQQHKLAFAPLQIYPLPRLAAPWREIPGEYQRVSLAVFRARVIPYVLKTDEMLAWWDPERNELHDVQHRLIGTGDFMAFPR